MPLGHAVNNVHTLYLGNSSVGTCSGKCEGFTTTSGTADTGTSQSISIGGAPALDSNANAKQTGSWTTGNTFTITGLSTTSNPDSILVAVVENPTSITVSSLSAMGIIFDSSARQAFNPGGGLVSIEEWHGVALGSLSSASITVTLSGTPTAASGEAIAINGAEDPTATFTVWDKAAGYPGTASKTTGGNSQPILPAGVTALNANDLIVAMFGSSIGVTETASSGFSIDLTTNSAASIAVEHKTDTSTTSETCPFAGNTNRWVLICDAYQSAPRYFVLSPDVASTTTTASPSTSTPSGYAWVYNTAGIQPNLNDIQSGTWQIDQTTRWSSTGGAPNGFLFATAWQCASNSLGSCTNIWKNWDTGANIMGTTTTTKNTYTTASIGQINGWTGKYLAVEYFVVIQYSASTAATTMTETTVSTASDIITPGWDSTVSLSGSLAQASTAAEHNSLFRSLLDSLGFVGSQSKALAKSLSDSFSFASSLAEKRSFFRSLTGSLTLPSTFAAKNSIFRTFAGSIAITIGNMVANVDSGNVICNSSPRSCSTSLSATLTMSSGLFQRQAFFKSLTRTLSVSRRFRDEELSQRPDMFDRICLGPYAEELIVQIPDRLTIFDFHFRREELILQDRQ